MIKRFALATTLSLSCAMPAFAAPTLDDIIAQLEAQGFVDITVSRTWLGRYRIEAESATREREIIFNKRTGEILRDYWEDLEDEDEEGEDEEEVEEDNENDEEDLNDTDDSEEELAGDDAEDDHDEEDDDDDEE